MNREIKFRAWDNRLKKMRYFGETNNVLVLENVTETNRDWTNKWEFGEADYEWIVNGCSEANGELMQFTGLKDKNGKEIYEWDIVRVYDIDGNGYLVSQVYYSDRFAEFCLVGSNSIGFYLLHKDYFEVIGNVYENPELINGTDLNLMSKN